MSIFNPPIVPVIHQDDTPTLAQITAKGGVGVLWLEGDTTTVWQCTSVSPLTFEEVGGANHNILSATHSDVFAADTPIDGDVLTWVDGNSRWEAAQPPGAGGGEANTASNVNVGGVGVFKQKTGVDLEMRGINAASARASVALDAVNNEIDIDVVEAQVDHNSLNNLATGDPHTQYQQESEKGVANGYASLDAGGTVPDSEIPAAIARDSELHNHPIDDTTALVQDPVDNTKLARLDVGAVSPATTRVITVPDADVTLDSDGDPRPPEGAAGGELGGTYPNPTVDATHSGSAHHDSVTLAGTPDYITIAGQVITRNQIDLTADVTGLLPSANIAADIARDSELHNQSHDHSAAGDGQTLSPGTLNLPTATGPSQTADGQVQWESDDDVLTVGDGAATLKIFTDNDSGQLIHSKTIVIEDPTASENISFFFTDKAITIRQVNDVIQGSATPTVTWNIRHSTTRNDGTPNDLFAANRATTTLSGAETTTFSDATIPAGSWVWLISSAQGGTVDELAVTIHYTID